jgi:AraC-like DNA-binding protein
VKIRWGRILPEKKPMIHRFAPIAPLLPYVESILIVSHCFEGYSEQIFSARGIPMLVFPFKQPSSTSFRHGGAGDSFPAAMLEVPALLYANSTHGICHFEGEVNFAMVMLRPTGAYHLTRSSLQNTANTICLLTDISAPLFGEMQEQLWKTETPHEAAHCIQLYLYQYLSSKTVIGAGDFAPVLAYMLRQNGSVTVADVARKFRCSERWVEKQCLAQTGLTPKTWLRLVRYRAAANYRLTHPNASWMEIVARFNYTDQSHLIRDFKDFSGRTPTGHFDRETHTELSFRQHEAGLSGLIKP